MGEETNTTCPKCGRPDVLTIDGVRAGHYARHAGSGEACRPDPQPGHELDGLDIGPLGSPMSIDYPAITRLLMYVTLDRHPLPWRVERDWTYEVLDVAGAVVVKCPTPEIAADVVAEAERIDADRKRFAAAVVDMFKLGWSAGRDPSDG